MTSALVDNVAVYAPQQLKKGPYPRSLQCCCCHYHCSQHCCYSNQIHCSYFCAAASAACDQESRLLSLIAPAICDPCDDWQTLHATAHTGAPARCKHFHCSACDDSFHLFVAPSDVLNRCEACWSLVCAHSAPEQRCLQQTDCGIGDCCCCCCCYDALASCRCDSVQACKHRSTPKQSIDETATSIVWHAGVVDGIKATSNCACSSMSTQRRIDRRANVTDLQVNTGLSRPRDTETVAVPAGAVTLRYRRQRRLLRLPWRFRAVMPLTISMSVTRASITAANLSRLMLLSIAGLLISMCCRSLLPFAAASPVPVSRC